MVSYTLQRIESLLHHKFLGVIFMGKPGKEHCKEDLVNKYYNPCFRDNPENRELVYTASPILMS